MNIERLTAVAAVVLLALAVAFHLFSIPEPAVLGKPRYVGPPPQILDSAVPQIEDFEYFAAGDLSPFLPYEQRMDQLNRDRNRRPPPNITIKPYPEVVVEPLPSLTLPKLKSFAANAPHCIGLIGTAGDQRLVVTMPGLKGDQQMLINDRLENWQLMEILSGNTARFLDPSGTMQTFPIGDGDLSSAQTLAAPAKDAPVNPKKGSGGALLLPKLTDGPGVVAPPVKPRRRPRPQTPSQAPGPVPGTTTP
jgi:hypothetical protein